MKSGRTPATADCRRALNALKQAIVEGDSHHYPLLIERALAAGATDDDIDRTAHAAIEALFERAEQPVTARDLAHLWPVGSAH